MAGGILGVEPLEQPGVYRASMADGSSMLVHGQPGEELFKRFKPAEATGPDALASNEPRMGTTVVEEPRAQPETASDIPENPVTRLPGGGASIPISAARAITRGEKVIPESASTRPHAEPPQAPSDVPQNPPTQQAQPQAAAPQQSGPRSLGYTMKGIDPATGKEVQGAAVDMGGGNIGIMLPGSKGTAGGLTDLGKKELEHDAATEAEVAKQRAISQEATQRGVDLAKSEAEERAAFLDEQKIQLQLQQQAAMDEQAKVQGEVDKLSAAHQKARDDFMQSKVDPDAYVKGGHGAVGIFSALSVALGSLGAAMAHTPNFALEMTQRNIDRNIQAQEKNIEIKGKAADNMLADLTRQTGDLRLAKMSMKQILTERAAIEAQSIGASTQSQKIQANATAAASALAAETARQDNALRRAQLEHVMTNKLYYRQGTAGSAPRIAVPTQESAGKMQADKLAREKFILEKQKAEQEKNGAGATPVSSDRTEKIASFASAIDAAGNIKRELTERGVAGDSTDDPAAGLYDRATNRQSNETLNQNSTQLAKGLQSAFGKSDRDAADAQAMAEGGGSGRDRYQAAVRNEKKLVGQLRTELSTLPPAQAQTLLNTLPAHVKAKVLGQDESE